MPKLDFSETLRLLGVQKACPYISFAAILVYQTVNRELKIFCLFITSLNTYTGMHLIIALSAPPDHPLVMCTAVVFYRRQKSVRIS